MKKRVVDESEVYPIYSLMEPGEFTPKENIIEVTDELLQEYERIETEYYAMQKKLEKLY